MNDQTPGEFTRSLERCLSDINSSPGEDQRGNAVVSTGEER